MCVLWSSMAILSDSLVRGTCWTHRGEERLGVGELLQPNAFTYITGLSLASETLSGVTQLKIGDIRLYVETYVCHFLLWPSRTFVLAPCSTPSQTSLNRILWFSDHYPYHSRNWIVYRFEFFCGAVWTQKLAWVPFLCELVAVVS